MVNYAMYLQPDLRAMYCNLITVTTEPALETREMRGGLGAYWQFLCDQERTLLKELDMVDETEHRFGPVYIPYTFVLDGERGSTSSFSA